MEVQNTSDEEDKRQQEEIILSNQNQSQITKFDPIHVTLDQFDDSPMICCSKISDNFRTFLMNLDLSKIFKKIIEDAEENT